MVETPQGERLTRAGHFTPNAESETGHARWLSAARPGGAPVFVPPDARQISVAADGTLSADGLPVTQIGLFRPADPNEMQREAGVLFRADSGVEPIEDGRILQGHLEESNVDPLTEIARMIEVSRAYELGQTFLDREDERIRGVIRTLGA
jgi:flagellar basal-body rod protein FlgF